MTVRREKKCGRTGEGEGRRGKKREAASAFPRTSSLLHFNFSPFASAFQSLLSSLPPSLSLFLSPFLPSSPSSTRWWHPFNIIMLPLCSPIFLCDLAVSLSYDGVPPLRYGVTYRFMGYQANSKEMLCHRPGIDAEPLETILLVDVERPRLLNFLALSGGATV